MMIRNVNQLSSIIREDLGYRRKEILVYESLIQNMESRNRQAILRGAVAVLYAHWEGYVKRTLQSYIDFVRSQRLETKVLSDPFVALAAKKQLRLLGSTERPQLHIEVVCWFRENWDHRAHLPDSSIISTKSNLTVQVFRDLIAQLGLEYKAVYASAEKPVIERLLALRNSLAHGEWQQIEEKEWREQLRPKIVELIETICSQVEDAAIGKSFRRSP
jgi:MAE_28990/MAE_18760-like HEPN